MWKFSINNRAAVSALAPAVRPRSPWPRRRADALVAALLILTGEVLVVSVAHRTEFAGAWEVSVGFRVLLLLAWVASFPIAMAGSWIVDVLDFVEDKRSQIFVVFAVGLFAAAVAVGVTTGRHFRLPLLRIATVTAVVVIAAGLTLRLAPAVVRVWRVSRTRGALLVVTLLVVLEVLNACTLHRLYPAYHVGLAVLTLMLAPLAAPIWEPTPRLPDGQSPRLGPAISRFASFVYPLGVAISFLVCAFFTSRLATRLAASDNVRFVYAEHGPMLRYGVQLAALLHRPAEITATEGDPAVGEAVDRIPSRSVDFRDRDLVLITIDALRADHLGAFGYNRSVTPNIDALAREGVRFPNAYCATPHTSYSVASIMTGKYLRPLLLQNPTQDHDTWAGLLRAYRFRTAAFYPPAVFFIDEDRFTGFRDRGFDFEYRRVEFAAARTRAEQVSQYLDKVRPDRHVFLWVHLFEPHEPYERHDAFSFGDRDIDRYDAEIAAADEGVGRIVAAVRARRPNAVFVLTADHGEEFGEHGGRYHGTSVYEEQVRVPLVFSAPGLLFPREVSAPVQTIDLLPTVLAALDIPRPARIRGRDLGPWLVGTPPRESREGFAFAETDDMTLLAGGSLRLVCARRVGACQLFDLATDPAERHDISASLADRATQLRSQLHVLESSHGAYELSGLRAAGLAWPEAIRRGLAGDGDAASDVAALLDDADITFRRKAAEILFDLHRPETAPSLRLALSRDEDDIVRRWTVLALTRLGDATGRIVELAVDPNVTWRRLAALALAETGDGRGEETLVRWWQSGALPFARAAEIIAALGHVKAKSAAIPLTKGLADVRLRPLVAEALAAIGEPAVRPPLLEAFSHERYVPYRPVLANALLSLGAGQELAAPLARFLGVPDPMVDGLAFAERGGFLSALGGPEAKDLAVLRRRGAASRRVLVLVARGGNGQGTRVLLRGRVTGSAPGLVRVGRPLVPVPPLRGPDPADMDSNAMVTLSLSPGDAPSEVWSDLPPTFDAHPGRLLSFVVRGDETVEVTSLVVVPLADELPPPPPQPWTPAKGDQTEDVVDDGT